MSARPTVPGPAGPLGHTPLFGALPQAALEEIGALMRRRTFKARSTICRAGDPGDSLFLITDGLAECFVEDLDAEGRAVARLRRGDVFGEIALVTGEPRSATVVASVPTTVLELDRDAFGKAVARHPELLSNLNHILGRRVLQADRREALRRRSGEAVALIAGPGLESAVPAIVAQARAASPRPVAALDARPSLESALSALDDLRREHGLVILSAPAGHDETKLLLSQVDRAVALVAGAREARRVAALAAGRGPRDTRLELVAVDDGAAHQLQRALGPAAATSRVAGATDGDAAPVLSDDEIAWLGRHLARTKLGLALGAGGAKGYAHVGALGVLRDAGYTVDYVAGSSIGAVVGAYLALGMGPEEIEAMLRESFTPETVQRLFKLSLSGNSTGRDTMIALLRDSTDEQTFEDLVIPLVAMAVDLDRREPAPLTEGPLWRALLAATALAGIFPPVVEAGRRLIDALALVPVPTDAVAAQGADITLSVNLMSRDTLPAWPGEPVPEGPAKGSGSRMLDTLLEVMELAQLDSSIRHAAQAHVVVTPRFGPATWREFDLADRFLAAGRTAAEEQLDALGALARPQPTTARLTAT
jgi:predicted acylesterase/phospholipase RssA/CRP-like cAMP-binding protein